MFLINICIATNKTEYKTFKLVKTCWWVQAHFSGKLKTAKLFFIENIKYTITYYLVSVQLVKQQAKHYKMHNFTIFIPVCFFVWRWCWWWC